LIPHWGIFKNQRVTYAVRSIYVNCLLKKDKSLRLESKAFEVGLAERFTLLHFLDGNPEEALTIGV
jgi:hypothetical protein